MICHFSVSILACRVFAQLVYSATEWSVLVSEDELREVAMGTVLRGRLLPLLQHLRLEALGAAAKADTAKLGACARLVAALSAPVRSIPASHHPLKHLYPTHLCSP